MPERGQLLKGVSHEAYHKDELPGHPHFSRGVALKIFQSPKLAWTLHPQLGGKAEEEEEDPQKVERLQMGSLIHSLLLGGGQELVVVPEKDWRKDVAKDQRAKAKAAGCMAVLKHKLESAQETCREIRKSLLSYGVDLAEYESEVTALWEDGGTACKGRLDLLLLARGLILDLKTLPRINKQAFERSVLPYGLDVQHYAYTSAVEAAYPEIAGRVELQFAVCETTAPFDCMIQPLGAAMQDLGRQRWNRGLKRWRECLKSGVWPGYGRQEPVEARAWQLEQALADTVASMSDPDFMKEAPDGAS